MTTANKVTILRILLIPFFVVEVLYYVKAGNEMHRIAALLTFAVAAICDGVDGYIARRYNQASELGMILDPIADKGLLLSGIITLSISNWSTIDVQYGKFPVWFPVLVITRDTTTTRIDTPGTRIAVVSNFKFEEAPLGAPLGK